MKKILFACMCIAAWVPTANANTEATTATQVSWTLFSTPDGNTWSADIESEMLNKGNQYYDDWYYKKMTITIADENHTQMGVLSVDLSKLLPNDVGVFGPVTQHLFNNDDQYEVALNIHIPGSASNGYKGRNIVMVYSLDGTKVMEEEGIGEIAATPTDAAFVLYKEGTSSYTYNIYKNIEETYSLAKSFELDFHLINYLNSQALNVVTLEDGIHFVLSHYEKSITQLDAYGYDIYDEMLGLPKWNTENNHFVIENYDGNLTLVDKVMVPTVLPQTVAARMWGIGAFSSLDVTLGHFTQDDKYNYIVMYEDMDYSWSDLYSADVFTKDGVLVGNLCSNVGSFWNTLSDIEGEESQWLFLMSDEEGQQLQVFETPSFNTFCTIPSTVDGKLISTNMDRRYDAEEGYKYVIGLNEAGIDANDNLLAQYGIYHKDMSVDHYVAFNMGKNAEAFFPLVNNMTLDPHLFDTDDDYEYIFMVKSKGANNQIYTDLYVCNEDGSELLALKGETSDKGNISTAAIVGYGKKPELFIGYSDEEGENYTYEFIALPLADTGITPTIATRTAGKAFNLQGLPASANEKGLLMVNGKKVYKE